MTILGTGFIGAETASYLNGLGVSVDLLSRDVNPLAGALRAAIAQSVTALHRKHVRTHFRRRTIKVTGDSGKVTVPSSGWIGTSAVGGVAVAVHHSLAGADHRIDHWDAAAAQGAHAARALLPDYHDAPDPGPYVPTTGFALQLYGASIAAFGALLPGGRQETATHEPAGSLTTAFFSNEPRMQAIAGLNAGRTLHSMRGKLEGP